MLRDGAVFVRIDPTLLERQDGSLGGADVGADYITTARAGRSATIWRRSPTREGCPKVTIIWGTTATRLFALQPQAPYAVQLFAL